LRYYILFSTGNEPRAAILAAIYNLRIPATPIRQEALAPRRHPRIRQEAFLRHDDSNSSAVKKLNRHDDTSVKKPLRHDDNPESVKKPSCHDDSNTLRQEAFCATTTPRICQEAFFAPRRSTLDTAVKKPNRHDDNPNPSSLFRLDDSPIRQEA